MISNQLQYQEHAASIRPTSRQRSSFSARSDSRAALFTNKPHGGLVKRILLLDDNLIFLRSIERLLKAYHFEVDAVSCHKAAFQKISTDKRAFDLALVDIGLNGCTGWDFAQALSSLETKLPVLLMSGEHDARRNEQSNNVMGIMKKPFSMSQLILEISKL